MKKLILLLLPLLLIGCNEPKSDSSVSTSSQSSNIASSESTSVSKESSSSQSVNNSSVSSSSQSSEANSSKTEKKVTVDFSNDLQAIDIKENKTHLTEFQSRFNPYLESLELEKVYYDLGGLKFGSSKASGKLTLNFKVDIVKVTMNVKVYSKTYFDYQTQQNVTHLDTPTLSYGCTSLSEIALDDTYVDYKAIESSSFEKDSKTLKIESENGRFIIKSIDFTFLA